MFLCVLALGKKGAVAKSQVALGGQKIEPQSRSRTRSGGIVAKSKSHLKKLKSRPALIFTTKAFKANVTS